MESLQPSGDRGAMSVSRRNFVNFWIGRHRPPLVGQIEEMLAFLGGRKRLAPHQVHSLVSYDGEGS